MMLQRGIGRIPFCVGKRATSLIRKDPRSLCVSSAGLKPSLRLGCVNPQRRAFHNNLSLRRPDEEIVELLDDEVSPPGTVNLHAETTPVTITKEGTTKEDSLEIKDPAIIFNTVWNKLEEKYGKENMRFPKEIIWLMGAPGAGKSVNSSYILKARGITSSELVMSSLLTSPEAEKIKKEAGLVGDSLVVEVLLEKLLQPEYSNGVLVDGFPRTKVQVECIKMLKDRMMQLRVEYMNSDLGNYFRRPVYRVAVLFIDEKVSVERQLKRGREAKEHNAKVRETGLGELKEERSTDFSDELARRRYAVFKNHYSTLQELQKHFAFSVINTKASIEEVQQSIMREFMYQSSLELGEETYDLIQHISIVKDITAHARQNLVRRLDTYQARYGQLFEKVIDIIKEEFIPILEKHSIAGHAQIRTQNPIFIGNHENNHNSIALQMVLDVLSERGYHVTSHPIVHYIPSKFDLKTGEITCNTMVTYVFSVKFRRSIIRQEI